MFYKIIKNNQVIDVNNVFLKGQKKHNLLVNTDIKHVEFLISSDKSTLYTTNWTNQPKLPRDTEFVEAVIISEDEYNDLREKLQLNVTIEIVEENPEPVIIEPKEIKPERKLEILTMQSLVKRVEELEKIVEQLLNK